MKRFLLALLIVFAMTVDVMAVGSLTPSSTKPVTATVNGKVPAIVVTLAGTADASNGSFPTYVLDPQLLGTFGYYLYSVEVKPGSTGPTPLYDIDITDTLSYEVTESGLHDRSATVSQVLYLADKHYPMMIDKWTVAITNNSVNSATVTIRLVWVSNGD